MAENETSTGKDGKDTPDVPKLASPDEKHKNAQADLERLAEESSKSPAPQ